MTTTVDINPTDSWSDQETGNTIIVAAGSDAYLKFDISDLIESKIINARLYVYSAGGEVALTTTVGAFFVEDTSWTGETMTSDNKPDYNGVKYVSEAYGVGTLITSTPAEDTYNSPALGWSNWNVTTRIQEELAGNADKVSFVIILIYPVTPPGRSREFRSNGVWPPYLRVYYVPRRAAVRNLEPSISQENTRVLTSTRNLIK